MEETLGLASRTETLEGEDAKVLDSGVCGVSDENPNSGGSVSDVDKTVSSSGVEKADAFIEPDTERSQIECDGDDVASEVDPVNGESHISAEEEENAISAGNEVTDEKGNFQVEDGGGDDSYVTTSDAQQNVQTVKSQQSLVDGETLSVAEDKADHKKASANENDEAVDSKQKNEENAGSETKDAKHSESVQVPEEPTQLSKEEANRGNPATLSEVSSAAEACREEETTSFSQKEENGEAMEIDYTAEEPMEKNVLDHTGNESADMAIGLSGIKSADCSTNHEKSPSEDAATGNVQDLKTEMNISLKEDNKAISLAEEAASVDCKETLMSVDATVNAESHDNGSLSSEGNQEEKDHECLDKKAVDHQDAMEEEDDGAHDTTHEAPSMDPNQKEDIIMEENPSNSDYADGGTEHATETNGVKRKADVLSQDSLGKGRKTVSLAKVSCAQRPSFKIGARIARAASQMAGSPSVLKGSNFGDETLSVESFVSQLHCAATDPDKENAVSEVAAEFFLDFRNSSASQQYTPEKVSRKRGRPSNLSAGGTEAFEFEEMGDTYWTDRVIHNSDEEQKPPTEKENYQVAPVELKPAEVKRARRPYRRRQSQISIHLPSDTDKPADFDENAPAELIMNFSETDTIPPEKSLSKMFRHFGAIMESQTEVDKEKNRARVVYRKGADAEVAYNSAGRFNIFGTKAVNYELSFTITETFKVQPYVVSLGEEEAMLSVPS